MRGAILVCGTSSDAGKSTVVAGICRWLARSGVRVAPFKAQNMSLNSTVTRDGAEIGRAQAAQAAAAGVEPEAAMNPVLLKPSGERTSQVVVMGRVRTETDARSYGELAASLRGVVRDAFTSLRDRFDVVVCEGAGSLAEINLRDRDLANLGLVREVGLPVLVVADIDRGGAFAGLYGSFALLEDADRAHVAAFVLNRFRGDASILEPALREVTMRTGRPFLGVLPWTDGLLVDAEDSLALRSRPTELAAGGLDVAIVRLPHISNFTDADPLVAEPGVHVRFCTRPDELGEADLVVVPGTKATVADLRWLVARGLDEALRARACRGEPVLGICGGYQMLGEVVRDDVESGLSEVLGLGLLPVATTFRADKVLARRRGTTPGWDGAKVEGYEIRHGRVRRSGGEPVVEPGDTPGPPGTDDGPEGCRVGAVVGTSWHGIFESDAFRRSFLAWVAAERDRGWEPGTQPFAAVREAQLDRLGDLVEDHLDTRMLTELIERRPKTSVPGRAAARRRAHDEALARDDDPLRRHGDRMVPAGAVDFAVNVVADRPPEAVRAALLRALDDASSYPDAGEAGQALAERHGRPTEEVLPTNGAAEAFWLVAAAFGAHRAVMVHPAFTEPEAALRAHGRRVEHVFRDPDDFSIDARAVPEEADLVVVGNPNNPTGTLAPAETLETLRRPGRVVVVDEAFMGFVDGERESLAGRWLDGLLVVRSVTKLWSVPGVRAGYVLGPAALVDALARLQPSWSVNAMACAVLAACARDVVAGARIAAAVAERRERLARDLGALDGVRVWPSVTNFLLLEVADGERVRLALLERGIAVRTADTFPGLGPDHLRVTVRGAEDNERLVGAFREVLA